MANKIYPEYKPPVTGNRARSLWNILLGIKGRLIGFDLISYDSLSGVSEFSEGKFMSNGCVVDVYETTTISLDATSSKRFFLYGYFDESNNEAGIEATLEPKKDWVVLGEMVDGIWTKSEDVTAFNLWTITEQHESDSDSHITSSIRAAIDNSNNPTMSNRFMTEFDLDAGVGYSSIDFQVAIAGDTADNDSEIIVGEEMSNHSVESFSRINGNHESVIGRGGMILADNRFFLDINGMELSGISEGFDTIVSNANRFPVESNIPSMGNYNEYVIMCSSHPMVIDMTSGDISSLTNDASKLKLMVLAKPNELVNKIEIALITSNGLGDIVSVGIEDENHNRWMAISSDSNPFDTSTISGVSIRVYGETGAKVIMSNVMAMPFVSVKSNLVQGANQPIAIKVSVLSGEKKYSNIDAYIDTEYRDSKKVELFRFASMPDEGPTPDTSIESLVCIKPLSAILNTAACEWPIPIKDYCMSDSKSTGSAIIVGGTEASGYSESSIAYSQLSDTMATYEYNSLVNISKAGSADFEDRMITFGGEGFASNSCNTFFFSSQTHLSMNNIPVSKTSCHGASINDNVSLVWGGDEDTDVLKFNRVSESWITMPSVFYGNNITYGKFFEGAISLNRDRIDYSGSLDFCAPIKACLLAGYGSEENNSGIKLDVGSFTPISIESTHLIEGSNIGITQYGTACYQSNDEYGYHSGCYDILSGAEISTDINHTGRYGARSSVNSDSSISFGPWEQYGIYNSAHNIFYHSGKTWLNGIAVNWIEG